MNDYPRRKHPRLKNFDYSTPGKYFVTLCVIDRSEILADVVGPHDPMRPESGAIIALSDIGKIVEKYILRIGDVYSNICAEKFVIMPNHVHMIIKISDAVEFVDGSGRMGSCGPTLLPAVIKALKRFITKEVGFPIFQRSFYEHIIRNEREYSAIYQYIEDNPVKYLIDGDDDF